MTEIRLISQNAVKVNGKTIRIVNSNDTYLFTDFDKQLTPHETVSLTDFIEKLNSGIHIKSTVK